MFEKRYFARGLAIIPLGLLVLSLDTESLGWSIATLALYSLPLAALLSSSKRVHLVACWLGVTLCLQTVVSPFFVDLSVTLPKNLRMELEMKSPYFPGISGTQKIQTDSKGYRTHGAIQYDDPGPFRIFAMGASSTESMYIGNKSTWTQGLEDHLKKKFREDAEVINTGVRGLQADRAIFTLKQVLNYHPDLAIFVLGGIDWIRHIERHMDDKASLPLRVLHRLTPFENTFRPFWLRNTVLGSLLAPFTETRKARRDWASRVVVGWEIEIPQRSLERTHVHNFRPTQVSDIYSTSLKTLAQICQKNQLLCLFATEPNAYQTAAPQSLRDRFWLTPPRPEETLDWESLVHIASLYNQFTLQFAHSEGFGGCDLAAHVEPTLENFFDDVHLTEKGSQQVAQLMTKCVINYMDHPPKKYLTQRAP